MSKIKYKYRIFHLLDSYPTDEDILFEIRSHLEEKGKVNEEFTYSNIKNTFSKKFTEDEITAFLEKLLKSDNLSIRETAAKRFYTLKIK